MSKLDCTNLIIFFSSVIFFVKNNNQHTLHLPKMYIYPRPLNGNENKENSSRKE